MTEEQLKLIKQIATNKFSESKEVTREHLIEMVCIPAIQDRVSNLINGEKFTYQDFKNKILDYNLEVRQYLLANGLDLKFVNNFNFENDFAPNRNGYIYEDFYSLENENVENGINMQMKNSFFGGEELNEKQKEYFNKRPLSLFNKYSANVFDNIFNTKNDKGETITKNLSIDTVNKSLNAYKAMNDKIKSLGIFDILFHLPSYFGVKKNIKNLKNSLVGKGLNEEIIDKVEKNEVTPKEASLDFLYNTDNKFKELVDNNKLSKEDAYNVFNNAQKTINKQVKAVSSEDERVLERKDEKERPHETQIEPNQRHSKAESLKITEAKQKELKALFDKGVSEEKIELSGEQITKENHLRSKNKSLNKVYKKNAGKSEEEITDIINEKIKSGANKNKVQDKDLQDPKKQEIFDNKLNSMASSANEIARKKISKSTIIPKDNRLKTSGEKIMNNKKILSDRINVINNIKLANDEIKKISEKIRIGTEKFNQSKAENEIAQQYVNEIDDKLTNLSKKEKNKYFNEHQDEKQKYDKALETIEEFINKTNEYNQEMTLLNNDKHSKVSERVKAMKEYNKLVGNTNVYGKGIEKYDLTEEDLKMLRNEFDLSADKIEIFKEMLDGNLEEVDYTPKEKLEIRNMVRDSYIETRKILDEKLTIIKEEETEDIEDDLTNERDEFLKKLNSDTTEKISEKTQAMQDNKSQDLTLDSKENNI